MLNHSFLLVGHCIIKKRIVLICRLIECNA
jgi:hypothetical protein